MKPSERQIALAVSCAIFGHDGHGVRIKVNETASGCSRCGRLNYPERWMLTDDHHWLETVASVNVRTNIERLVPLVKQHAVRIGNDWYYQLKRR